MRIKNVSNLHGVVALAGLVPEKVLAGFLLPVVTEMPSQETHNTVRQLDLAARKRLKRQSRNMAHQGVK
jgi:hypothetical protein